MGRDMIILEADYLIIGAGASGMAFADELIHNTSNITIIIVDKHSKPGGHWNDAYSFVTLHQPAAFYGVKSKPLGHGVRDLVTCSEINAYYELVMKDLLKTGRVKFFPLCEYHGNGVFHSLVVPAMKYSVSVRRKTVDATYVAPKVPSTRKPEYQIGDGVNLVPINGISHIKCPWKRYVVIGGGKTGIDAVLFLLNQSVDPDNIIWVIPNDCWYINREVMFSDNVCNGTIQFLNCILGCETVGEFYEKGERAGVFFRLDPNIEPTKMKAATVSESELKKLRLIKNVVRKGRIERIEQTRIILDGGEVESDSCTLYVDCSANGLSDYTCRKIFDGVNITLQDIKQAQSCYSACVIGAFESYFPDDEDKKNKILVPMPHTQTPRDFLANMLQDLLSGQKIGEALGIIWIQNCRLQPLHHVSYFQFLKIILYVIYYQSTLIATMEKMLNS